VAATVDIEKQLGWEARQRPRAGIAAGLGAVGLVAFLLLQQAIGNGVPTASFLTSLQRAARPGQLDTLPSLQAPVFQFLHDHSGEVVASGLVGLLGYVGMAWAVGFLAVAARARRPELPRWSVIVTIVGGVLLALGICALQVAKVTKASTFLDSPRTVADASATGGLFAFAQVMQIFGSLALAIALVLVSLNAMRTGLLTRLFGVLGIITGATLVIFPLPIVQVFWLAGLALLCLGLWPGGMPPAWRSGMAEPWPSARPQPARQSAPAPAGEPRPRAGARGKRKKRN
jgi:hypothetical protein